MSRIYKDRIKETSTTIGNGPITLLGAAIGFRSFADIGDGNTCKYIILDANGISWEVGEGTYNNTGNQLVRTIVEQTSAGNTTPISLSPGTHTVYHVFSAASASEVGGGGGGGGGSEADHVLLGVFVS